MESKKINQLATELAPELSDLTIIGDPTTGISKKITLSQMASLFTGTVEEYANLASFPLVGTADTIYIALDTNIIYRWNTGTSAYVELSPNIVTSLVFNDANGFDGTISLVGSTATLTITTALTQGSIGFIGASGALTQDNSNFFWDNTNKRLGINTNAPTTAIDAFGSGIIGRLNGTSTNNAFLGFASAGTNRWSIGNVQSDNRFRIYSETNTSELVSVLQTGEVGIGIANPLTKLHIFGGASALIANLDANTSVAKSISFRSGNSSRINLEVSGIESGSNAGANLFIRTYTDAGSLIETPFTLERSSGNITILKNLNVGSSSIPTTTNFSHLFVGQNISMFSGSSSDIYFGNNFYYNGGFWKYKNNNFANMIITANGDWGFNTSVSGTAGNNITFLERLRIKQDGSLGLGTDSPISKVHMQEVGGSSVIPTLTISQDGDLGLDWVAGALNFYSQDSSANSKGGIGHIRVAAETAYNTGSTPSYMAFYTHSNSANNNTILGATTERMRISSSGSIGIGTTPPSTNTFGHLFVGRNFSLFSGSSTDIYLGTNFYYESGFKARYSQGSMMMNTDNGNIIFQNSSSGTAGATLAVSERMRITNGGNVYIGTATGDGYKLQISGNNQASATFGQTFVGVAAYSQWVNSGGAFVMGLDTAAGTTERLRLQTTNGGLLIVGGSNNTFIDYSANVARFYGGSGTNTFGLGAGSTIYYQGDNSQFYPTIDNARSMGLGSLRYTAIWAVNGTIQTSDEREKTDIIDSDLGLDFVTKLRPVSFKWKVGQNTETTETIIDEEGNEKIESTITPRAGIRTHYGLIAQEVEQLLNGKDFGGFIHDKDSDVKGLRYDQFVPLLIKAIQEQQAQIEELKSLINK